MLGLLKGFPIQTGKKKWEKVTVDMEIIRKTYQVTSLEVCFWLPGQTKKTKLVSNGVQFPSPALLLQSKGFSVLLKEQTVLLGELRVCLCNVFLVILPMKKVAKALFTIVIGFLAIAMLIANHGLTDYSEPDEKDFENSITPRPTPYSPLPTISPPQNSSVSSLRTTFSNAPCSFEIKSPSNMTYTSNKVVLWVTGFVIGARNINLSLSYSVDGKGKIPLPIDPRPPEDSYSFIGRYSESITIPGLSDGVHWIVVFGDQKVNGVSEFGEATVYFTINRNPVRLWAKIII